MTGDAEEVGVLLGPSEFQSAIAPMLGQPFWQAEIAHAGNLKLYAGERRTENWRGRAYQRSSVFVWVHCCEWRVHDGDRELARSQDAVCGTEPAWLSRLRGACLAGVRGDGVETLVSLSNGVEIVLQPYDDDPGDEEHLWLETPNGALILRDQAGFRLFARRPER